MNINVAKQIDLVDYLSSLGHEPKRISSHNYWYSSPLTPGGDATPSFKINRRQNTWFDWSEGKNIGGNIIDFGVLFHQCTVSEFLQEMDQSHLATSVLRQAIEVGDNHVHILTEKPLQSSALIHYLQERRIPEEIYVQYCKEVYYQLRNKTYYAIGFKNDAGGYELRNKYVKLSSSPKKTTLINNGSHSLAIFEGFFNFLSYLALAAKKDHSTQNFLILNSTSFFENKLTLMQSYEKVHLYLDNDKTGQKFTHLALRLDNKKFLDQRLLYKDFKDVNDFLIDRRPKQEPRLKLT